MKSLLLVMLLISIFDICYGQQKPCIVISNYCNSSGFREMQKPDERAVGVIDVTIRSMRNDIGDFYSSYYVIPTALATVDEISAKDARLQMAAAEVVRPWGYTFSNRIKIDNDKCIIYVRFTLNSTTHGGVYCEAAQQFEIRTHYGNDISDSAAGLQYEVSFKKIESGPEKGKGKRG